MPGGELSRKLSVETGVSKDAVEALEEVGIDQTRLRMAIAEVDDQGDGELELYEFREFWGLVFPQRPMTESAWKYTETMFREIDKDGSNKVSFVEIVDFLESSLKHEQMRSKRPSNLKVWCWLFCGNGPTAWLTKKDGCIRAIIILIRTLEIVVTIVAVCVMMVETLPEHQFNSEGKNLQGTHTTHIIEGCCVGYFVLHLICYTIGYPSTVVTDDMEESPGMTEDGVENGVMKKKVTRVWNYFHDWETWVNLFSVIPYVVYLSTDEATFLSALTALRLSRVLRVLRLVQLYGGTKSKVPELGPALVKSLMSLWFLFLLIVISMCLSASFLFFAEQDEATFVYSKQLWFRDNNSIYVDAGNRIDFQSIPEALWWSIVTLTTVGYGDTSPKTIGGKIIAVLTMFGGLIVVGYPITILTGTFQMMEIERIEREDRLERHRELYEGIRSWVISAELEHIKTSRELLCKSDRAVNRDMSTKNEARKEFLLDLVVQIEQRLASKFSTIEKKIQQLESKKRVQKKAERERRKQSVAGSEVASPTTTSVTATAPDQDPAAPPPNVPKLTIPKLG
eukprot:TRINITY_DN4263_c1_g3_i1.p1 TRINITY_DN4263_c1_g3~~TRINITY_DN4263_c1_g3_i1.p1  ORF type:complete len:590 (+),score=124.55 TRINITY_DN4263_c1_g3_i1:74-1771(+)